MKTDIYETITNQIIEALDTVQAEDYEPPFARLTTHQPPRNPTSSKYYSGINTLTLWLLQDVHGYSSNEWATFKQWKDIGASVKKGQKSSKVIFYKQYEKDSEQAGEDGESIRVARAYAVFNADQVENYEPETGLDVGQIGEVEQLGAIEGFIAKSGAKVQGGEESACYSPSNDVIYMPKHERFFDNSNSATDNYYSVLFHELTHWTGHRSRLARQPEREKNSDIAFEELIAELGSAYLCGQFGIHQENGRKDHACYIQSWLKALRNDKKFIFRAASSAQRAVDWLNNTAG